MKLSKKTLAGVAAVVLLSVVSVLWGPEAVQVVRDAVSTAPVTSLSEDAAPVTTESDTAPVETSR